MDLVEQTSALDLEWIGSQRFDRAARLFRRYEDQAFSFTDCTSFAVMRELRLTEALTKDDHFRIAGFSLVRTSSDGAKRPSRSHGDPRGAIKSSRKRVAHGFGGAYDLPFSPEGGCRGSLG